MHLQSRNAHAHVDADDDDALDGSYDVKAQLKVAFSFFTKAVMQKVS